jgi:hypothetical protein
MLAVWHDELLYHWLLLGLRSHGSNSNPTGISFCLKLLLLAARSPEAYGRVQLQLQCGRRGDLPTTTPQTFSIAIVEACKIHRTARVYQREIGFRALALQQLTGALVVLLRNLPW